MSSWQTQVLALQARIRDLEAVIDHLEQDNLELIDQVRDLKAEVDRREGESWRPHR